MHNAQNMQSALFLVDYAARSWTGVDDLYLALCKKVREIGLSPVIVYAGQPSETTAKQFQQVGAAVYSLSYRPSLSYYREIRAIVRQNNVVIADVCFFDYFRLVVWFVRLAGVRKIIYTEANSGESTATSWRAWLLRLRTKFTALPITMTVAMSEFIKRRLVRVGFRPERVTVIHQGIDVRRFAPDPKQKEKLAREYSVDHKLPFLVCINRLFPFKRTDVVLRALAVLVESSVKVHLFVAGEGPLRTDLEKLAAELGVAQHVQWLGHYPHPHLLLQACDIFVIASVGEAFGYVTAEAMATGLAVVGSNSGATPELVESGRTGLLAEPLNPESFADKIHTLIANHDLLVEMGQCARKRAQEYFALDRVVHETAALYAGMIAR